MDKTTRKIIFALAGLVAILWLAPYVLRGPLPFGYSPWHRLSPFTLQVGAMARICHKLRDYHYAHPNIKAEEMVGRTISDYVAMNVLTPEDATYIRDHHIVFHEFDPSKASRNFGVPVLEAVDPAASPAGRIMTFSDAHCEILPLRLQTMKPNHTLQPTAGAGGVPAEFEPLQRPAVAEIGSVGP